MPIINAKIEGENVEHPCLVFGSGDILMGSHSIKEGEMLTFALTDQGEVGREVKGEVKSDRIISFLISDPAAITAIMRHLVTMQARLHQLNQRSRAVKPE